MIIELETECEDRDPHKNQGRTDEQVKANEDEAVLLGVAVVAVLVGWGVWEFGKWLMSLVVGM